MSRPQKPSARPHGQTLEALVARLGARVLMIVMMAVSGGIALVALSLAIHAQLSTWLQPAGAAAVTTLVFAGVTGAIGLIGPALLRARARHDASQTPQPGRLAKASPFIELAGMGLLALAETVGRRRKR